MNTRRTVRHFSNEEVPKEIITNIIKSAGKSISKKKHVSKYYFQQRYIFSLLFYHRL